MRIEKQGRESTITYQPWFNWIMMGATAFVCAFAVIWALLTLPNVPELKRPILNVIIWTAGPVGLFSFLLFLVTPARCYILDGAKGAFRIRKKYFFWESEKTYRLAEIDGPTIDPVGGNGPEAYWVKLRMRNGKTIKFAPHAFTPENTQELVTTIINAINAGGGRATRPAMRTLGRANGPARFAS